MSGPSQQRYKFFSDQNTEEGHFDVTFQFGDNHDSGAISAVNGNEPIQFLHAHSFALWPSSKVFEKTLFGPLAHKGPIPIIRHSYKDFKEFLTFLYIEECNITMNNVMALVDLGEYYEVKLLKDQCDAFLTQNSTKIEHVLKVYESLKVYSLKSAMSKVMQCVAGNTVEILKTEEFLNAKKETIFDIAKMKNLKAKQEELFEAICKWNEHNCPEDTVNKNEFLKNQVADIIPLIDFSSMDGNFLNNFVVRKGFLFPSFDDLADALCAAATKKQKAKEERLKTVPKRKRIQITDGSGNKGYADICNPDVIRAVETMIAHNSTTLQSLGNGLWQTTAPIGYPTANQSNKYYLIRNSSGNLAIKDYRPSITNPNEVCCYNYGRSYNYSTNACQGCAKRKQSINSQNEDIIAPITFSNNSFTFGYQIQIEFV